MSHFITAVFTHPGQDYEELLAPYNEQDENYMKFQPCEETKEELQTKYEEVKEKYAYQSFEQFMSEYYGYHRDGDAWGYLTNPDAKWDWYEEGGRWNGFFRTKDGGNVNSALVSEIDFSPDQQAYGKAIRFWEVVVEGQPLREGEKEDDFFHLFKSEYYRNQYGTKEKYAMNQASVIPWAFVTADGEWVESGSMGWWGMSDATEDSRDTFAAAFRKYVEENQDQMITAVDCHI